MMRFLRRRRRWTRFALAGGSVAAFALLAGSGFAQTQAAPTVIHEPQISGATVVGATLTASTGTWTGSPTSFRYQWLACPSAGSASDGSDCLPVAGARFRRHVPENAEVGKRLRVRVTASNADGSKTVASNASTVVKQANAPANSTPPTISGSPTVGSTLTATSGKWTGTDPITFSYTWRRCDNNGGSCASISGATDQTYTLKSVDSGNTLRVRVTAKNSAGTSTATSVPTAVVTVATTPPPPATNGCAKRGGTVPVAGISPPARLLIDQAQVSPSTVTYGTRAITVRFHVSACGGSVQGALVYVTAVPYGMFANTNEQATGSDGWASLQLTALAGYPVSNKQQVLVMFVRARKAGENLLGGISTRRLISFHISRG